MATQHEPVIKEIGDRKFEIRILGAKKGKAEFWRLFRQLAPIVGAAFNGRTQFKSVQDLLNMDISGALAELHSIPESELDHFCDLFAANSAVELEKGSGKFQEVDAVFDNLFAANYGLLFKWLGVCMQVNFGGFFGAGGASLQELVKLAQTRTQ